MVKLSNVAESQPQAPFAALSLAKSVQFGWSYLQRILPNFDEEYGKVWPAVIAGTISAQLKRTLVFTSCTNGGHGNQ